MFTYTKFANSMGVSACHLKNSWIGYVVAKISIALAVGRLQTFQVIKPRV